MNVDVQEGKLPEMKKKKKDDEVLEQLCSGSLKHGEKD